MTKEELWKEATQDGIVFNGKNHHYAIHNGVKIEKYNDGSIVLYSTIRGGEFYKKLTNQQVFSFLLNGFFKASLQLSIKIADDYIDSYESTNENKKATSWRSIKERYEKKLKAKYEHPSE